MVTATKLMKRIMALAVTAMLTVSVAFTGGTSIQAEASSGADECFRILFEDLGYSAAAACGIMANIRAESSFRPSATGGGYGLCQWTGGRVSSLRSWCSSNGYDSSSMKGQLAYMDHELRTRYTSTYNYITSVENTAEGAYNAGYKFCYSFEAPANRSGQSARRGSMASNTYWPTYRIYCEYSWIETSEGKMYYLTGGEYALGWTEIDGEEYYFDANGHLKTGLFSADGKTYYTNEEGVKLSGWQDIGGSTYYFGEDGAMQSGWIEVDGKRFFLDPNGKLQVVNSFEDKAGTNEVDITNTITEQNNTPQEVITAPAVDPVSIPDHISEIANNIQKAGNEGTENAAAIGSTAQEMKQVESTGAAGTTTK